MPLILPIPAGVPLHLPISGTDLAQMFADMVNMPAGEDFYAKLAANPVLKIGTEIALGRALTPEEYKQLLNTPDSPLQKATAIKYLYFQILAEIIKIRAEITIELIRLKELAAQCDYWIEEAEKERDEKIKQISSDNEQEKLDQEKKIMEKYFADIAPIQNYLESVKIAQQNLQVIENKLQTLAVNVVTTLNDRTRQIAVIYEETQTVLIATVTDEIARYDRVLGTLTSQLADAEREFQAYSATATSPDDPELLRREHLVAQLSRQTTGVRNIRQLNEDYMNDEQSNFARTTQFCQHSDKILRKILVAHNEIDANKDNNAGKDIDKDKNANRDTIKTIPLPPPVFQAGMNGVLLEFATTVGRKIRSRQTYDEVKKELSNNPSIIDALGGVPAQIALPTIDQSTLAALVQRSNEELQACREQIKSSKAEHEKIHVLIAEQAEQFEKKYGLNPMAAPADGNNTVSSQNNQEQRSLDKDVAYAQAVLKKRVQAHAVAMKKINATRAESDNPPSPIVNPQSPFHPKRIR